MIRRISFIVAALVILAAAHPATAQQSAMPIVGWLHPQPLASSRPNLAGFRKGLGEAGFVEGKNVMIELRPADGKRARLPALADDLVRRGVAAIMAGSAPAALAAKRATQTIPIVFTSGADPVRIGLVSSFNRPGGNVTGFHIQFSQVVGKRLSLLHEMVPRAARIAVLVNPAHPSDAEPTVRNATETARALGLDLQVFNAGTIGEIDAAFAALVLWRAGAVMVAPDPFFVVRNAQIVTLAARHVLPTSVVLGGNVAAGGLMSYGPDLPDLYRQAGLYVGRILKGEKPANLPVQQPTKYELVINLKTAKALGISVPPSILLRANKVIE
ncbi:MAG: ABC transporter substrate-binding protein [Alphaproteobacteria bacterium]|nr:ABC transporter substrate-binding protein [Alphaproteobacteria bacterium]